MRHASTFLLPILACLLGPVAGAQAPVDSAATTAGSRPGRTAALAAVIVAASADERIAAFARRHQDAALDRAADAVDPFGRAGTIVPTLAAAVLLPRLAGRKATSNAALRVALAYFAADAVESIVKPVIGRHRPDDGGGPWRFHPFSADGDWHSTPSAHTVHAFALATALDIETRSRGMEVSANTIATLVALQRVYRRQHWPSDVVASAVLASAISRLAEDVLRARGVPHLLPRVH